LGNTLLLTPLVQEIEASLPGAEVDILTACPAAEEIFREFACVRTVHRLPHYGIRHPLNHLATLLRARGTLYDLILDPCPKSWSSRFATRLLRGSLKVGFCSPYKSSGTRIKVPIEQAPPHMAVYPVHLFRHGVLGPEDDRVRAPVPKLSIGLTAAERGFGRRKLLQLAKAPGPGPILAVAPCGSDRKQLAIQWWREMLRCLAAGLPLVRIVEVLPVSGTPLLPEYPGYLSTRVRRVAALINAADCFVSTDSGLMHLGAATATTTVGLFKATDPSVYAPYGGLNVGLVVAAGAPPIVAGHVARLLTVQRKTTLCN
jgi:ADP-heptose:LPS heptosyltransferase